MPLSFANDVSVFKARDKNGVNESDVKRAKLQKLHRNVDIITKVLNDIITSKNDNGYFNTTWKKAAKKKRSWLSAARFYASCVTMPIMTGISIALTYLHSLDVDDCGRDYRCELTGKYQILDVALWIWTLWTSMYLVANFFYAALFETFPLLISPSLSDTGKAYLYIVLANSQVFVHGLTQATWYVLFVIVIALQSSNENIRYFHHTGICVIVYNVLRLVRCMTVSYLETRLNDRSQAVRMASSLEREEILYNLTNYRLYDDRSMSLPTFEGLSHTNVAVLGWVSSFGHLVGSESHTINEIKDTVESEVSVIIKDLQEKLKTILQVDMSETLAADGTIVNDVALRGWLDSIQRAASKPEADMKLRAHSIIESWLHRRKAKRYSDRSSQHSSASGSKRGISGRNVCELVGPTANFPMNRIYGDMDIPNDAKHYSQIYDDDGCLAYYTGASFSSEETAQAYWDLYAKKLGFFMFWNMKREDSAVQITQEDLAEVLVDSGLDVDKVWDLIDADDTMAVDLSECVQFVSDTFKARRDLARTIMDSKAILAHVNFIFILVSYFVMLFVILEAYGIAQFKNLWQAFSASLIAFSFVFGNSLRQVWENLVYLFTIHAFDVGDIIIVNGERYTVKTISLSHVGCMRKDNASVTIPMQTLVAQGLHNISRSGTKWEGFTMLVDIDTNKEQLAVVADALREHLVSHKRYYGGLYRIFFVPTDGLVHKLKMGVYFNYSQNESDMVLLGVARTMLYDNVTTSMRKAGITYTLPNFAHQIPPRMLRQETGLESETRVATDNSLFTGAPGTDLDYM